MQIANIYGIKNQKLYEQEKLVMILAHLAKFYKKDSFSNDSYIIMDNGLYENSQVSDNLNNLVELADSMPFKINELIIPDVLNDLDENIKLFEKNLDYIKKYNKKYTFMFVAQSKNEQELEKAIDYINKYNDQLNLVVGISKLCPFDRTSNKAIEIYKKCKFPIHFLGIKESFEELKNIHTYIRSCDTSQIEYIAKNEIDVPDNVVSYKRKGRNFDGRGIEGIDVNLEKDYVDYRKITKIKDKFKKEFENEFKTV